MSGWQQSVKRWPGWMLMACALAALLVIGVRRENEPSTADERVQSIAKRLACPVCDGESVAESRAASAQQIRVEIETLVEEGQLTDDEIVVSIDDRSVDELALLPSSSGIDLLIWVLPTVVGVAGVGGLVLAFARWRRETASTVGPTAEDRELVAAALEGRAANTVVEQGPARDDVDARPVDHGSGVPDLADRAGDTDSAEGHGRR